MPASLPATQPRRVVAQASAIARAWREKGPAPQPGRRTLVAAGNGPKRTGVHLDKPLDLRGNRAIEPPQNDSRLALRRPPYQCPRPLGTESPVRAGGLNMGLNSRAAAASYAAWEMLCSPRSLSMYFLDLSKYHCPQPSPRMVP